MPNDLPENALRASEERYRMLVETSPDAICLNDLTGRFLAINQRFAQWFGFKDLDEVQSLNKLLPSLVIPEDRHLIPNTWQRLLQKDTLGGILLHVQRQDGTRFTAEFSVALHRAADGTPQAVLSIIRDVSAQHALYAALRESEFLLQESQRVSRIGSYILDIRTGTWTSSPALDALLGIGPEYPRTLESWGQLIHPEDRTAALAHLQQHVLEQQHPLYYECRVLRADGEILWVLGRGELVLNECGEALRLSGTIQDLSIKKQAELELAARAQEWQTTFDAVSDAIWILDAEFKIVRCNQATTKFFNRPLNEILGTPCWQLVHQSNTTISDCPVLRMQSSRQRESAELRLGERWILVTVDPIFDIAGKLRHVVHIIRDITLKKMDEHLLEQEKERLAVTLQSITEGVIATTLEGRIRLMNRVAEKLTGWSQEDAAGKLLPEVFHLLLAESRELYPLFPPVVPQQKPSTFADAQFLLRSRQGHERLVTFSSAPIHDNARTVTGSVWVFQDITEKQKTETILRNAQKLESIGVLAGGIAHDFNNLLSVLFGYLELTQEHLGAQDAAQAGKFLKKSLIAFNRAKALTQQLLTFSKGGTPVRKKQSVKTLLQETVQFVLSGSNIHAEFDLPANLWSADIDAMQISQVIDNLVINARQAMPSGGTLHIAAENIPALCAPPSLPGMDYIHITIRDHGTGIAPEHLPHIFEPFFTTKRQGSGLGLATAYSIVSQHQGALVAESPDGEGAIMHLYLPATEDPTQVLPPSPPPVSQPNIHHGCVLVMDDEPFSLDLLTTLLTQHGFTVRTAKHGEAAIQQLEEALSLGQRVLAAILDLTIPGGLGGAATLPHLLERLPALKAIASSGYSEDPCMATPNLFGFSASLIKPYRLDELLSTLESLLASEAP